MGQRLSAPAQEAPVSACLLRCGDVLGHADRPAPPKTRAGGGNLLLRASHATAPPVGPAPNPARSISPGGLVRDLGREAAGCRCRHGKHAIFACPFTGLNDREARSCPGLVKPRRLESTFPMRLQTGGGGRRSPAPDVSPEGQTPGALDAGRGHALTSIPGFPPCGYVTFSNKCVYGGRSMLIMFRRLKEH